MSDNDNEEEDERIMTDQIVPRSWTGKNLMSETESAAQHWPQSKDNNHMAHSSHTVTETLVSQVTGT